MGPERVILERSGRQIFLQKAQIVRLLGHFEKHHFWAILGLLFIPAFGHTGLEC